MEEKIYKQISEIQGRILRGIMHRAYLSQEYHKENPEELNKTIEYIANKDKWDYCGISNKEDLIKLELLNSLVEK
jgi:CRISPR/Cas system-associated endonuclease/helicase Cas3